MKKRIAFILPFIPKLPAGGVIVVFQYASYMANHGFDVTIYYKSDMVLANKALKLPLAVRKQFAKIESHFYPNWYKLDRAIKVRTLFDLNDVQEHDFIVATGIETAWLTASLPIKSGRKFYFVQDFENWDLSDEKVIESYKLGMKHIVVSSWLKEIVTDATGIEPYYVSNGIDMSIFTLKNPIEKRKRHSIVFQYRSAEGKGCSYAIECICNLKRIYSDLEVTIISKEPKPDIIPSWAKYIQNASLEEVATINNESKVFICTSISEGFGLPGLEAMACGCVLCTTDYLGAKEYAVHMKNSLVSKVKDVQGMVMNVNSIFNDESLANMIVKNAIITAKDHSLKRANNEFCSVFSKFQSD